MNIFIIDVIITDNSYNFKFNSRTLKEIIDSNKEFDSKTVSLRFDRPIKSFGEDISYVEEKSIFNILLNGIETAELIMLSFRNINNEKYDEFLIRNDRNDY